MSINRRWIAREWLYLLAGFLWTFVVAPIILPPLARLVLWIFPPLYGPVARLAEGLAFVIMYGAYLVFQLWRITSWAIRTLREPE